MRGAGLLLNVQINETTARRHRKEETAPPHPTGGTAVFNAFGRPRCLQIFLFDAKKPQTLRSRLGMFVCLFV